MKISELDKSIEGKKIRVTGVAPSQAEQMGYCNDTERLMGQIGRAEHLHLEPALDRFTQLRVAWDNSEPGKLMLAGDDQVEILS